MGDFLDNAVMLGKQFKHMTTAQIEMITEKVQVMIRQTTKE